MKKGLKITGIVLGCILVLMFILPYAFRGKIKEVVVNEGNKMLHAQFNFESLDLSLFKNFPKASITLSGFWLKGIHEFENDTLVKAGEITAAVDVTSLFGDSGYDISKISLTDADVKAIILKSGKTNWDIVKSDSTITEEKSTESSPFKIKLQRLTVEDLNIIYDDRQNDMYAEIKDFKAICSGDLGSEQTTLELEAEIEALTFKTGNLSLLSNANIATRMEVNADLVNNKFTLKENEFRLNAIRTNLDGWVAMLEQGMDMDIKLNTNEIGFKEILSLIPAIYAKDFESIQTDGSVKMEASAKGVLQGDTFPQFKVLLDVKNALFRYPSLPAGVDRINIHTTVENPGGSIDLTQISVNPLSFRLAGNPFSLIADVSTPISDPNFKASAKGTLDLGMIKQVYPLEDMELNGIITADMSMAGRLSYLEKEVYDQFDARGTIGLKNMTVKMKDMPDIDIKQSTFTFTPQYLNLSETTVNIGKNDLTADCRLENYMAFALKGKTIKGSLNIHSNYFNLNDFMTTDSTQTATTDTTAMSVLEVPKNIDFNMDANMKKVLFDKMQFDNIHGKLLIRNGKVDMKNLSMNAMGGSAVMNGYYSTAENPQSPELNAGFNLSNLSFAQTFKELDMIRKMAPIFENLKGNYSGSVKIDTRLDHQMSPVLNTMQGNGSLSTKDLSLSGINVIDQIADAVGKSDLKNIQVKDMKLDFTLKDGRIKTKPFDLKMGETNLNLSGSTGLDQTIDYRGKIKLPASAGTVAKLSTVDLKIGGTFSSPKVSLDTKSMANQVVEVAKDKAIEEIGKKLGVDLSDAQKQKEALVEAAKNAGSKLVEEAQKQADALVEKAGSNPLKKLAAQKGGEALVKEAQRQANNLTKEAEKQGDVLIEKAKQE